MLMTIFQWQKRITNVLQNADMHGLLSCPSCRYIFRADGVTAKTTYQMCFVKKPAEPIGERL